MGSTAELLARLAAERRRPLRPLAVDITLHSVRAAVWPAEAILAASTPTRWASVPRPHPRLFPHTLRLLPRPPTSCSALTRQTLFCDPRSDAAAAAVVLVVEVPTTTVNITNGDDDVSAGLATGVYQRYTVQLIQAEVVLTSAAVEEATAASDPLPSMRALVVPADVRIVLHDGQIPRTVPTPFLPSPHYQRRG